MIPHDQAWNREGRLETMRRAATMLFDRGVLERLSPLHAADTYGILPCEVEAELMRHLGEGVEGK